MKTGRAWWMKCSFGGNLRDFAARVLIACVLSAFTATSQSRADTSMTWATVGDINNPPDVSSSFSFGSVPYAYRVGKYEVTYEQYSEFLNQKAALQAAADGLKLFNPLMNSGSFGGLFRAGGGTQQAPYVYTVKADFSNKPVGYVSWYDCARFTNWLNNGKGTGDTESGAYTLLGGTAVPSNALSIARNPAATVFLPNDKEWHKAAFYEPGASGDGYWKYATRSDAAPTIASATITGDISNPGANVANYNYGASWNGLRGGPTTVGSAGPLSDSYYGVSDMTGNEFEWVEVLDGSTHHLRGGSWGDGESFQHAPSIAGISSSFDGDPAFGFRVAAIVPEPSCFGGLAMLALYPRRFKRRW